MRNRIHEEKGKCGGEGRCVCVCVGEPGSDSAKRIQGSSLGRRAAQVQLSRAKVLGCRTVFHRVVALCSQSFLIPSFYSPSRIGTSLEIGNGCTFASFLSVLVPFPGLGTSLTLLSASSHTRSPPERAAEVASSVIHLEKLFGGLVRADALTIGTSFPTAPSFRFTS